MKLTLKTALFAAASVAVSTAASAAFPIATTGAGSAIVVTSTDDVIATYLGNSASFDDQLTLGSSGSVIFDNKTSVVGATVNLGSFAVGTELQFALHVLGTGDTFFSGDPTRNIDGQAHATVDSSFAPGQTLVSFEDLRNGPFEFNDLSFSFTNTAAVAAVPEPASWAMMIGGIGFAGGMMRRQRRVKVSKVAFA